MNRRRFPGELAALLAVATTLGVLGIARVWAADAEHPTPMKDGCQTGVGTEALVVFGTNGICRFAVTEGGWRRLGNWGERLGDVVAVQPVGDEVVVLECVGERGVLKECSRDGEFRRVIRELDFRPHAIYVHPDRQRLFVSAVNGAVWRLRRDADEKPVCAIKNAGTRPTVALSYDERVLVTFSSSDGNARFWGADDVNQAGPRGLWNPEEAQALGGSGIVDPVRGDYYAVAAGSLACFRAYTHEELRFPMPIDRDSLVARIGRRLWAVNPKSGGSFAYDTVLEMPGAACSCAALKGATGICDLNGGSSTTGLKEDYWARKGRVFHSCKAAVAIPQQWAREGDVPDYVRMPYNADGSMDVTAGLIGYVAAVDYDGDGDKDLIVSTGGVPEMHGTFLFENPTPKGVREVNPVFKAPVRLDDGYWNANLQELRDGSLVATLPGSYTFDFRRSAFRDLKPFNGLGNAVRDGAHRCNVWRLADYDGDGCDDLFVSTGNWWQYGWQNAYDSLGNWTNGWVHGNFYWLKGLGGSLRDGTAKWGRPEMLRDEAQEPLETNANPNGSLADFDGDGDLDIVATSYRDDLYFFENNGTRTSPIWLAGRLLRGSDGRRLHVDLCVPSPVACDWDGDGSPDILCSEEDGRVSWMRNTGRVEKGLPVFDQPVYFRQEKTCVNLGCLSSPFAVDWDDDGDEDLIVGNSAGHVIFVENLSGPGVEFPKWADPVWLAAPESPYEHRFRDDISVSRRGTPQAGAIMVNAGHNGSIQGPVEGKWGYTCLSVADWDGDGLKDVMVNSIWGEIIWFRNVGTRGKPRLAAAAPVECEWPNGRQPALPWGWNKPNGRRQILTQWRTTPVMVDWNGDGLMDILLVDQDGDLAFWERAKGKDGRLLLKAPRKAILNEDGTVMHPTCRPDPKAWQGGLGGPTGRRKIAVCDWDGDGKLDLVMNCSNACWFRQVKSEKGLWYFQQGGNLGRKTLAGHSSCPTAADFNNDGIPDLVVGSEDGFLYYLRNPRKPSENPVR